MLYIAVEMKASSCQNSKLLIINGTVPSLFVTNTASHCPSTVKTNYKSRQIPPNYLFNKSTTCQRPDLRTKKVSNCLGEYPSGRRCDVKPLKRDNIEFSKFIREKLLLCIERIPIQINI